MRNSKVETEKEKAVQFLQLVVGGKIDDAYQAYVDMEGRHHNPFFAAGFPALRQAMKDDHVLVPDREITVVNALEDGDRVAVHSHLRRGQDNMAVVHLFRFKNGRIVEMWDCGQALPANSPNADGAF